MTPPNLGAPRLSPGRGFSGGGYAGQKRGRDDGPYGGNKRPAVPGPPPKLAPLSDRLAVLLDGLVDCTEAAAKRRELGEGEGGGGGGGDGGGVGDAPPMLRMERAAMIYFGVPSYGVHVNGWVRDPDNPSSDVPWAMWVATRSMSKATYPGLFDQMVAGGQPSKISFDENVRKECEEEASLPPNIIAGIVPVGAVSYRYATAKGLSTKVLRTYDLEMPRSLQPLCADGEVEEFRLLPISEVLTSLREQLPLWKPNSALIAIDFCVRHGFVDQTEPGYAEIVRLLNQRLG